ncbi:glycosyltransferase [Bergeyella zoohelcum]|uniref:Glycosyl transferase, group 1 family protein n=1 Tax=Bergeyella zoohelcum TaxID=1015 RepID=A0A7Z8YMB2_9FLAO|nr:glycosyltransferase [Bergeyella zoohelcum]VDH02776.1 glycosyl transferase, group 1 family protein [Bergeyella zoohelcum]
MKRKKIYFILPGLTFGGAERVIFTILNHLDYSKFQPKLILFSKVGFPTSELNKEVEVQELGIERIRYSLFKILPIIKKEKPDFVFSGWGEISAYLSLFIKLFPKTQFIARETNVVSQHVTRKEILFFYKFYNNFHHIICQSDDMMKDLITNFKVKASKITKINNPVDVEFIDNILTHSSKPNAFSGEYKNVVAIGNLSSRKGFDNLLKVFSHLKNEKIKLHILGDGRDKALLHQMKEELGLEHVIFHGQQKNPYQFLKYADLFILSSRYEGFPNVLLEAGVCGTYALANNCPGGINEIIIEGENGTISSIEEYEDFALKIKELIHHSYDRNTVRDAIVRRYSLDIILKKYNEILAS